jgi:hypothetical protein
MFGNNQQQYGAQVAEHSGSRAVRLHQEFFLMAFLARVLTSDSSVNR